MVLDTSLLNTQQYKVRIKGKVEKSRERSSALSYISTTVANFTYMCQEKKEEEESPALEIGSMHQ